MRKKNQSIETEEKSITRSASPADKYYDLIGHQLLQGNYAEAVSLCERLFNYLPRHAPQRVDVLARLGMSAEHLAELPAEL